MKPTLNLVCTIVLVGVLLPVASCSTTRNEENSATSSSSEEFGLGVSRDEADAGQSEGGQDPLYLLNLRVFGEDVYTPTSYLTLSSELDEGTLSLDDSIEVPGGGSLWALPKSGEAYFVSAENLTITKYVVTESGKLEEANRLGLLSQGISFLVTEVMAFDDVRRAFLFDMGSAQAVEIDLEEMAIERTIDVSKLLIDEATFTGIADGAFHRRGDELIGATYGSSANYDWVAPTSKVAFFDLTDSSIEVLQAPCGGLVYSFAAGNGDIYFASDPWVAGVHEVDSSRSPAPCLVRLPEGSRKFDEVIALNELTGGITGGIVPGSDGYAYVRVLDEDVFAITEGMDYTAPFYEPAWSTWRIDLPSPTSAQRIDRPHIAGGIKFANVDGAIYQNESSADFASTTLVRTTGKNVPTPALRVPGVPWNIVQLR